MGEKLAQKITFFEAPKLSKIVAINVFGTHFASRRRVKIQTNKPK